MVKAFGIRQYGGAEVEELLEVEMPTLLPDELLVEVRAAGVNPVDWKIRSGFLREMMPLDFPAVLGSEISGVIRGIGKDTEGFSIGDPVFGSVASGSGGFAEFAVLPAAATAIKPTQVSFIDAATLPVAAATAYDGVTQLDLQPGETLLINGASGGVGVAAVQIARDLGINVIGIAGSDKQPLVESLGATFVAYGEGVAERVRAVLPTGVDAIFDLAGGDGLHAVADLLADRTKLITAGDPTTAGQLGGHMLVRDRTSQILKTVAAMVAAGELTPHVEDVLDLDHAAAAMAAVETGHAKGKVVVQVSA